MFACQLQVQSARQVECEEWAAMDVLTSTSVMPTSRTASALGSSAGQTICSSRNEALLCHCVMVYCWTAD